MFEAFPAQFSQGAPTLKPLCPTHPYQGYSDKLSLVAEALQLIQQGAREYAMKGAGFLNSMEKFSTHFGLKLSHFVFSAH
jgi:hypothetical protein